MSTAAPRRPIFTSPYPSPAIAQLLGHRLSISHLDAIVQSTISCLHEKATITKHTLLAIVRAFDTHEWWAKLERMQRVELLQVVKKDGNTVKAKVQKKGEWRDGILYKKLPTVTMLFSELGLGSFNSQMRYHPQHCPSRLGTQIAGLKHIHGWETASETVFTRTVLMDLYPKEAETVQQIVEVMDEFPKLKDLHPLPIELLKYAIDHATGVPAAQTDSASYLAVKRNRIQADGEPDPRQLEPLTENDFSPSPYFNLEQPMRSSSRGEHSNAAALARFEKSDPHLPFPLDEHNKYSLSHHTSLHRNRNFLGVLTPRQAQRYGRPPVRGALE